MTENTPSINSESITVSYPDSDKMHVFIIAMSISALDVGIDINEINNGDEYFAEISLKINAEKHHLSDKQLDKMKEVCHGAYFLAENDNTEVPEEISLLASEHPVATQDEAKEKFDKLAEIAQLEEE